MFNNENIVKRPSIEMVDEGLRQHMIKVFNYMCIGLLVTALAAFVTINTPLLSLFFSYNAATDTTSVSAFAWIITFSPLILLFMFSFSINRASIETLQLMFWGVSILIGMSLAPILLIYTSTSIVRVFLITAATFGGMSLLGYTTKKDLSKLGSFLYMGVIGLLIASLTNIFMKSTSLDYAISYIAVIVFTGLCATDTQKIKYIYYQLSNTNEVNKAAICGALSLYINFVNLFMSLLRIMGDRR